MTDHWSDMSEPKPVQWGVGGVAKAVPVESVKPTGMLHPVIAVFDDMQEIATRKAEDYAEVDNVFSNFEFTADIAGVDVDTVFMVMLGTKMARLRELHSGGAPNFESIEDTLIDLANYAALSVAYTRFNNE